MWFECWTDRCNYKPCGEQTWTQGRCYTVVYVWGEARAGAQNTGDVFNPPWKRNRHMLLCWAVAVVCLAPGPAAQGMLCGAVSWGRAACRDVGIVLGVAVWAAGGLSPICVSLWHPGITVSTEQQRTLKVGVVLPSTSFDVGVPYCFRENWQDLA